MERSPIIAFIFLLVCLLAYPDESISQNSQRSDSKRLSEQAKISLLTCGPGEEFASMFGHSALWVYDPSNGIDRVYNYGTYDFETPNFVMKFMKGTLIYHLSVVSSSTFMNNYINENRSVYEQVLNLDHAEKQVLYQALEKDYLPENREYLYDVYQLNCSSLIRDRVFEATDKRFNLPENKVLITYRMTLQQYAQKNSWLSMGLDLLLGMPSDQIANTWEQMYLPDKMLEAFEASQSQNGESLVLEGKNHYQSTRKPENKRPYVSATVMALLAVLVLMITRYETRNKRWFYGLDIGLFIVYGLLGCIFFFMWFLSLHEATSQNLNLVWAHPLLLAIPALLWVKQAQALVYKFAKINAVLIALVILGNVFANLQYIPTGGIFMALLIMVRLFRIGDLRKTRSART